MNKILVQLKTGDKQEVEFEQPVSNVELVNATWEGRFLARKGILCFFVGMLVVAFYYRCHSTYNASEYVVIPQEAYFELHKDHNMVWHAEKRAWIKNNVSPAPP